MRQLSLDLNIPIQPKAALRAVPMNIFSTLGSLQEVIDLAESRLPIINKNDAIFYQLSNAFNCHFICSLKQ